MNEDSTEYGYFLTMTSIPVGFSVAFRKARGFAPERQKQIKCPYCGRTLISIDRMATVKLYRYPKKKEVVCHEYKKCQICHETIGFFFVTA